MSRPVIHPRSWYSADDLEEFLGRKLADQCVPLATIRGRYWGQTIIDYLNELGKRKVDALMAGKTAIDSAPGKEQGRAHVTQNRGQGRNRLYQDTEP